MKSDLAVRDTALPTSGVSGSPCAWLHANAAPAPPAWQQNALLASLPAAVRQGWGVHARLALLHPGQVLHQAGGVLQWVYFPLNTLVSLTLQDRSGVGSEVAAVGPEGVVGLPLMDGNYTRSQAEVQHTGHAVRLPAVLLAEAFAQQAAVRERLLAYSQALVSEIMQTVLCARHHSLEQQLCRFLLRRLERQATPALAMTQEAIAARLGVRRESVTLTAARLQQAGVIRYARGRIEVLDAARLHERGCDCHRILQREFRRLLDPRG